MATRQVVFTALAVVFVIVLLILPATAGAQDTQNFTAGVRLFQDGLYEQAVSKLKQVVKAKPDLESAWYYLGRSYLNMPRPDLAAALDAFHHAVEINPSRPGTRLYVGEIYEKQRAYEEAIQVFQEELRLRRGRDIADIKMSLGRVYYLDGRTQQAVTMLSQLLRSEPEYVEALYYLGLAETQVDDYKSAIEHFKRAGKLCEEYRGLHSRLETGGLSVVEQRRRGFSEEYLAQHYGNAQRFISDLHLWPALNKARGDAHFGLGEWARARNAYRRCLDLDQGGNPVNPEPDTLIGIVYLANAKELFYRDGMLFQAISMAEAALESITEALKKNANYAPAHNAQGEIYLFQAGTYVTMPDMGIVSHSYNDAIGAFEEALSLDNQYVEALNNLGIVFTEVGRYDEALTKLQSASKIRPKDASIRANIAKAYLGQEEAMKALEEAQTALALDGKNYEALLTAGLVDFYYRNRLGQAIDYFRQAIAIEPTLPDGYLKLGDIYSQMESWYRARQEYIKALERIPHAVIANTAPQRAQLNYLVACTYHHGKLYEKEIEYLNNALAIEPSHLDALRQIARAYEASEQYRAAEVALESALEASPNETIDAEIYVQTGEMYERQGKPHDAIAAYTAALSADETNYPAQQGLQRLGAGG